uniref:BHLH domain-containing protein n=1 Tax=Arundo donax TaxID=35708 RepID=A0A0A9CYE5_ARUDO
MHASGNFCIMLHRQLTSATNSTFLTQLMIKYSPDCYCLLVSSWLFPLFQDNSPATGSAPKKARVQTSSSAQSTLKVRKERLGDRITALHQIVSPFGKTDTASVLQETIGYIRFLLGQIEALSYPYLGYGAMNGNSMQQQQQTDAEDGGEGKADLRSRGLFLVPVSCTSHLAADDNGASDFWAVAAAPPPPLGGIVWR